MKPRWAMRGSVAHHSTFEYSHNTNERSKQLAKIVCSKAIAAGHITDEAEAWLISHGATVEGGDVNIVRLPEKARLEEDGEYWRYIISFYGPDGNDEPQHVEIEWNIDAYETKISLITE